MKWRNGAPQGFKSKSNFIGKEVYIMEYIIYTDTHEFKVVSNIPLHENDIVRTPDVPLFLKRKDSDNVFYAVHVGKIVNC